MSLIFSEVSVGDNTGTVVSVMEGGLLDDLDLRELLKYDEHLADVWGTLNDGAWISTQQYRWRTSPDSLDEPADNHHFALMRTYDHAMDYEQGLCFLARDDVEKLEQFKLTAEDLAPHPTLDLSDTTPAFPLGRLVATPGALDTVPYSEIQTALRRHISCDWGDLCAEDKQLNDAALKQDDRLFSVYHTKSSRKFYIITEGDRSATTILLPDEY